jgi:hypothetical protein
VDLFPRRPSENSQADNGDESLDPRNEKATTDDKNFDKRATLTIAESGSELILIGHENDSTVKNPKDSLQVKDMSPVKINLSPVKKKRNVVKRSRLGSVMVSPRPFHEGILAFGDPKPKLLGKSVATQTKEERFSPNKINFVMEKGKAGNRLLEKDKMGFSSVIVGTIPKQVAQGSKVGLNSLGKDLSKGTKTKNVSRGSLPVGSVYSKRTSKSDLGINKLRTFEEIKGLNPEVEKESETPLDWPIQEMGQ